MKKIKKHVVKKKLFAQPYSLKEGLLCVYRYYTHPSNKNKANIQYISSEYVFNDITPKCSIVFIGDIMDLYAKNLIISENIKNSVEKCDYLIGNLEATITTEEKIFMDQRHDSKIMDFLESLFPPSKIFLSVGNNHAGDYGEEIFLNSVKKLKNRGFNVFGMTSVPYLDLPNDVRIIGGSTWSNRECDYYVDLNDSINYVESSKFNILYPHWGYEMELFPRIEIVEYGKKLLKNFDAIIGHHSHCPQPVSYEKLDNHNKLIAYSLGNFCTGFQIRKSQNFQYGILLKCGIGADNNQKLQIGQINWHFIRNYPYSKNEIIVESVNKIPFL